jgi:hypothetical protein
MNKNLLTLKKIYLTNSSALNNSLNQLDEILCRDLRPWLDMNKPNEKFATLVSKVKPVTLSFHELYEFDFYRPFNPKLEYYQKLIISESNQYCNSIVTLINEDDNAMRQKYWYDDTLKKQLPKRFTDIVTIIKERFYFAHIINPRNSKYEGDPDKKTETFIIQFLKVALVKIYLEIQDINKHLESGFLLTEHDIYDRFLNQAMPENTFLKRKEPLVTAISEAKQETFPEIKSDVVSNDSFTYINFNTRADDLTNLFSCLKENNFIAKETPMGNFKRAFSGKELSNSVVWSGSEDEFAYFIHLVTNEYNLLEPLKRNLWKVACKCFIKFDGSQFDQKKLKGGAKPELTAKLLEEAVELIK